MSAAELRLKVAAQQDLSRHSQTQHRGSQSREEQLKRKLAVTTAQLMDALNHDDQPKLLRNLQQAYDEGQFSTHQVGFHFRYLSMHM